MTPKIPVIIGCLVALSPAFAQEGKPVGPTKLVLSVASDQADRTTGSRARAADAQGWTTGTADAAGLLRAETSGDADRRYTLRYRGFDRAGNASDCTTTVTVPASRGRA